MKKSVKEWVIAIFVVLLILIIVGLIWHFKSSKKPSDNKPKEEAPVVIDVAKIISEIKEENSASDLVYESANIPEFTILVYAQDYFYNSILIDSKDGTKTDFLDLVNKDLFKETELRLLNLKYPEFIVNALNNTEVKKYYYVKDNEVIIYYDNYTLAYPYNETLSLNINYNEIKDLIKFTPVLDTEYQNADGFNYDASNIMS